MKEPGEPFDDPLEARIVVEVDGWAVDVLRQAMITGASGELNPHIEQADPDRARAWLVLECMFGAHPDLEASAGDVAAYARRQAVEMYDYAEEVGRVPDAILARMELYREIARWAEEHL